MTMLLTMLPVHRKGRSLTYLACGAVLALLMAMPAFAAEGDAPAGADAVTRRLSQSQYRQAIADAFGPTVIAGGRVEPDVRENGLMAVGASHVSVTASGLEQYDSLARTIASQVVSEKHRATLIPCKPANEAAPDDACASQFLGQAGRILYRRPMTAPELQSRVAVASTAAKATKDFYSGLGTALSTMLVAPQFLFRYEDAEADPKHAGQYRMDAFSKASQLSYFLWNAAPDPQLLASAGSGELNTEKGLAKQVDRMLASPRLEAGLRAYFSDMLGLDGLDNVAKDPLLFRKYTTDIIRDGREQTLRTLVDLLLTQKSDYRDVFTSRKTYLTPVLGSIYSIPVVAPDNGWKAHEFAVGDPRGGIIMQVSFLALHAHPGRTSPTLRGKALRELLLCQKVPDPPANVNFAVVQDTNNPQFKTARERLEAHRTNPACAGCHKIMDPMGLAMENFDSIGVFRTMENGAPIDASGEMDGKKFADPAGLGQTMHDNPAATSCLVSKVYAFATGRPAARNEAAFIKAVEKDFAAAGYRYPDLLRRIATSEDLYRVSPPQTGAADTPSKLAAGQPQETR